MFSFRSRSLRTKPTQSRLSARLWVEPLEDRAVPAVLTLSTATLPADTINIPYDQTISASGGNGTITLSVGGITNALPGIILPPSGTGSLAITGTPTAAGTETFTVTASDGGGDTVTATYALTVNPAVALNPATLPADSVNVPYKQTISAVGGTDSFYASQVVSYSPGTLVNSSYEDPAAALGGLDQLTGTFDGTNYYLTPFDPAFSSSNLVEVGAGGSLELKLAQTASTNGFTIGVHTGFGLLDADYPDGVNTNPAGYTNGFIRQADVLVSADGVNWGDLGLVTFDNPSNYDAGGATGPEGLTPGTGPLADPGKPFLGNLNSFNGEDWQQTLATLNGSAGGTWLNLTGVTDQNGTPITGVNYIKFVVPSDPATDPNTGNPELMMVDAVVGTNGTPAGGTGAVALTVSNVQNAIPGLTVPTTGTGGLTITGTPHAAGTETFTVTATDSVGATTTTNYSLTVVTAPALQVSPATVPTATVGDPFQVQFTAKGGSGKGYVFSAADVPAGLTLSSDGLLSGTPTTPTVPGTPLQLAVTVTDSDGVARTIDDALTIDTPITLTTGTLPVATVGDRFDTKLSATGGAGGYVFTADALPSWLKLSAAGVLTGTPPATADASSSFVVTVTDRAKGTASADYSLTVDPALVLSPTTLTVVTVGNPFSTQLTAAGGSGTGYTFTGTNLPGWLSLSPTGLLSGTPTSSAGSPLHFTVTVKDSNDGTVRHTYVLTVRPALVIRPTALPVATVGDPFHTQLQASGGSGAGFIFTASNLPAWLTLSSTGLLSGMPPAPTLQPLEFTITVTDSNSATGTHTYTLTVDPALTISPGSLPSATVGVQYHEVLTASGGSGAGYTFKADGLPSWLTLSRTGILSGKPKSAAGAPYYFTITATDNNGGFITQTYILTVS